LENVEYNDGDFGTAEVKIKTLPFNLGYRINTPQFSGLTTLIKSDTELRL
jgi:hypothetical protein